MKDFVRMELICEGYPDVEPLGTEATPITPSMPTTNTTVRTTDTDMVMSTALLASPNDVPCQPSSSPAVCSCLLTLTTFLILCTLIQQSFT